MTKITELPSERLIQMGKVSLEIAESIKLPAIIKQWESYLEYLIKEKTKVTNNIKQQLFSGVFYTAIAKYSGIIILTWIVAR